jgi:RHS repeat-associated protein
MKKNKSLLIIGQIIAFTLLFLISIAQPSTTQNYILTNTVKQAGIFNETMVDNLTISTQGKYQIVGYFDGLGRPLQNVETQASPTQKDIITGFEYDGYGREVKKYLPYSDINNTAPSAGFRPGWKPVQSAFYQGVMPSVDFDTSAYMQSAFEVSPLNRVLAQGENGMYFQPNFVNPYDPTTPTVKYQYLVNKAADNVRIFNVDPSGNISSPGFYGAGQINIKITTDEQGQTVKEFSDLTGHTILKRVIISADSLQTYYLYDDLEYLRAVIQPEGVASIPTGSWTPTATFEGQWMFLYRYDQRNRMVMKKIPGADSTLLVYDQWDRIVLTQDGNLRLLGNWLFTKYDILDRPIVSGMITDSRAQSLVRTDAMNATGRNENISTSATEGYTLNNSFPSSSSYTLTVLTTTHYDSYTNLPSWSSNYYFVNEYGIYPENTALVGKVIAVQNKIIGTTTYMRNLNYFDDRYRITQTRVDNADGGTDRVTKIYSFDGKPQQDFHNHTSRFFTTPILIQQNYSYDQVDRLLQITHQTASQEVVTIAQNAYNEVGQSLYKKIHQSPSHPNYLQKIDYEYHIRGWLNSINEVASFQPNYDESDLFNEQIDHELIVESISTPQYNGNISESAWKGGYDEYINGYSYSYDQANRLTAANFGWGTVSSGDNFSFTFTNKYNEANIQYDHNGNIKLLDRYHGDFTIVDDLHYANYNGNQLGTITDQSGSTSTVGFQDRNNGTNNDYQYDANGNLTFDYNKNITGITYNYLNLPTLVTVGAKGTIAYTYDASGNKLQRTLTDQTVTPNKITNYYYAGDFLYRNDTLEFVNHPEGRLRSVRIDTTKPISIANLKYIYDYYLKDHLGSVRTVITTDQETDMYTATMEAANATTENLLFANISSTTVAKPTTPSPGFDSDNSNAQVSQLNGNVNITGNKRVGPSIVLKVMAGDTVSISTYAWYAGATQGPATSVPPIANDILPLLTGGVISDNGTKGGTIPSSGISSLLSTALNAFLAVQSADYSSTKPKAFLNWMVVDEEFNAVSSPNHLGAVQIPLISGSMQKQQLIGPTKMVVRRNGWLYVYVSNESTQNVFFDNLAINQTRGPVLEVNDFYPFGLQIPGSSSAALKANYNQNRYKYIGDEFDSAFSFNKIETDFRDYDPEIGRFVQIDELAEITDSWTTYGYASNNPISRNDPLGLKDTTVNGEVMQRDKDLASVTVKAKHTRKNLENTYWYLIRRGIPISKVKDRGLRNWLTNYDDVQKYLNVVHENIRTQGILVSQIASLFIPYGEIAQALRLGSLAKLFQLRRGVQLTTDVLETTAIDANRLHHIFDDAEHALEDLVTEFGSEEKAYNAVQDAANEALESGKLTTGENGILPKEGEILNVGETKVRLIGGRVIDGKVRISSFSRKGL